VVKMKPVKRTSLVDTVVERIHAVISEGHLAPGDRLPTESELVKQLEVSRTVLREAVGRLETMGLVSVRGPRGMFVGDSGSLRNCIQLMRSAMAISPREVMQFTQFRRAIECDAVRAAALQATEDDIAELEALCEEIRRDDLDYAAAFRIDLRFHRKLLDLGGNELMRNVMSVVQEFMLASIVEGAPPRREPELTYRGHRAILEAVQARDANAAEKAMREHLDSVLESLHAIEERDQPKALPSAG
jgi:GntR family transcriptional regulator, transcriptional repressor for pyruvate dehydrogenase complex